MATENQYVINLNLLTDTSDELSKSKKAVNFFRRYKVVNFFCKHKVLMLASFLAWIFGIIVGVPIGQQVGKHQQDREDNDNKTISNGTNKESSSNAFSNQINQQIAQEKIIKETQSSYTSYSSLEKCHYETSEVFLIKLVNNTFENEDYCTIGSTVVKTICESESSHHACEKCTDGSMLPSSCFCDKKVNCVNDAALGGVAADDSKKTCSECAKIFNDQFKYQGNASCSSTIQRYVDITCKDGYGGSMCNVITALLCKLKNGQSNLKECNSSKLEECTMKSTLSGNYYHCEPFTDSNIGKAKGQKVCYLDAAP